MSQLTYERKYIQISMDIKIVAAICVPFVFITWKTISIVYVLRLVDLTSTLTFSIGVFRILFYFLPVCVCMWNVSSEQINRRPCSISFVSIAS